MIPVIPFEIAMLVTVIMLTYVVYFFFAAWALQMILARKVELPNRYVVGLSAAAALYFIFDLFI